MELNTGEYIERCIADALERFRSSATGFPPCRTDLSLYVHPQVWGDTSCGFGGGAGQAITSATTVVVLDDLNGRAAVYHGRFAYLVQRVGRAFMEALASHRLPGAIEGGRAKLEEPR
jgi:hypothetical protein